MFDFGGILASVVAGLQDVVVSGILGFITEFLGQVLPGLFGTA